MEQIHAWSRLRHARAWWTLGLLLVMTACRGSSPEDRAAGAAAAVLQSAEEVHIALLAALRANDREQVMALTVDDQQAARAETWLRMVQSSNDSTITDGPYATGGNLSRVEIVRVESQGVARRGWSRWIYARKPICHVAELAQTSHGWRVTRFYTTTEACTNER